MNKNKKLTPLFVSEKTILQIEQEAKQQSVTEKYNSLTEEQKEEIELYNDEVKKWMDNQSTPSGQPIYPPLCPSFWSSEASEYFETIISELEKVNKSDKEEITLLTYSECNFEFLEI